MILGGSHSPFWALTHSLRPVPTPRKPPSHRISASRGRPFGLGGLNFSLNGDLTLEDLRAEAAARRRERAPKTGLRLRLRFVVFRAFPPARPPADPDEGALPAGSTSQKVALPYDRRHVM